MKVEITEIGRHRRRIAVEADWEEARRDYDDLLSEYSRLPVPGFRPGKAPKAMVEKQFERQILDDAAARCVRRLSRKALDDEGVTVTGPISVTDLTMAPGATFLFTAEFTELPSFDLPDYTSFELGSGTDETIRDEISMRLLEGADFDVPEEMVREELRFEDDEVSVPGDGPWEAALSRVRLLLVLGEISRRDGVEIDERDIDERLELIAGDRETDVSSLRRFMLRNGGLSRLSGFILAEKTLDYLIDING